MGRKWKRTVSESVDDVIIASTSLISAHRVVLSHVSTVEADHVNIAAIGHVTRMSVIDVDAVDHVILIATDTVKDHVIAVEALSDVIAAEADLVNEHARIEAGE